MGEKQPQYLSIAAGGGKDDGSVGGSVGRIGVAASSQQAATGLQMVVLDSTQQWGGTLAVRIIGGAAGPQQQVDDLRVALGGGVGQGRHAALVGLVGVAAPGGQQGLHHSRVAVVGRAAQRRLAKHVGCVGIGAGCQQLSDHTYVACSRCCSQCCCSASVACLYAASCFDQQFYCCFMPS